MPKKVKELTEGLERLRRYVQGQTLQPGMFSTLDEIIKDAPFDVNTANQWRAYLKPGRMLKREGVQFPLKKEEMDYIGWDTSEEGLDAILIGEHKMTKEQVREIILRNRPEFKVDLSVERMDPGSGTSAKPMTGSGSDGGLHSAGPKGRLTDVIPSSWAEADVATRYDPQYRDYPAARLQTKEPAWGFGYGDEGGQRLTHTSPGSEYQESVTRMGGVDFKSHFEPDTVSHSRISRHETPTGKVRVVEEVQSDIHRNAAESLMVDPKTGQEYSQWEFSKLVNDNPDYAETLTKSRRGYYDTDASLAHDDVQMRLGEIEEEIEELSEFGREGWDEAGVQAELERLDNLEGTLTTVEQQFGKKPTNAPYKNPKDYAGLELRKQLIQAAEQGDDYLALTRSRDQKIRYGLDVEGSFETEHPSAQRRMRTMEQMYDKVYLGELEKLAKRYKLPMETVDVEVRTTQDMRPEAMRDIGWENLDHVDGDLHMGITEGEDYLDAVSIIDEFVPVVKEVDGTLSMTGVWDEGAEPTKATIQKLRALRDKIFEDGKAGTYTEAIQGEYAKEASDIVEEFKSSYNEYTMGVYGRPGTEQLGNFEVKDFPAIKLSPEDRERILKLGVPQFQRGGLVRPDPGLGKELVMPVETEEEQAMLDAINARLDPMAEDRHEILMRMKDAEESEARLRDPQYWTNVAKRIPAMMTSQWKTLNQETGEAEWNFGHSPPPFEMVERGLMTMEEWQEMAEIARKANEENPMRPGIIDETIAIRGLGTGIGNLFRDEPIAPPEYAQRAMERSEELMRTIEDDWDIGRAEGLPAHLATGAGMMLGQVPSPKSAVEAIGGGIARVARPVTRHIPEGVKTATSAATLPVRAGLEFFDPTVKPSVSSYLMGTGFGGALGTYLEPTPEERRTMEMEREQELTRVEMFVEQAWDEQDPEVQQAMLSHPEEDVRNRIWESLTPEQKYAALEYADESGRLESIEDAE